MSVADQLTKIIPGNPDAPDNDQGLINLPLLGSQSAAQHQRTLTIVFILALAVLGGAVFYTLKQANELSQQVAVTGQALMQSQRLAKSVSQALVGTEQAFPEVRESAQVLSTNVRALRSGAAAVLPYAVPLAVMAGYWYTASTGFANPAVTLARSLTDSFAGIRPMDAPGFILAQIAGLTAALALDHVLRPNCLE
mgnify:CR=1 FL=1